MLKLIFDGKFSMTTDIKTWNGVFYATCDAMKHIVKTIEPYHLILIHKMAKELNNIVQVKFHDFLVLLTSYDPPKRGVNSFWDILYFISDPERVATHYIRSLSASEWF